MSCRRRAASSSSLRASLVAGRATKRMSYPPHGPSQRLALSRNTRFERFLTTAFPSFFPAINATRPVRPRPSGVGAASTMMSGWADRLASRKTWSISLEDLMVPMPSRTGHRRQTDGQRTLRPLRRRAARTARPPRVAMRARNPCDFARFRLFGWYVRFTVSSSLRPGCFGAKPDDYRGGLLQVSNEPCTAGGSRAQSLTKESRTTTGEHAFLVRLTAGHKPYCASR